MTLQNLELEHVKKERAALLKSLAALKADQGRSGADMQNEDIKILRIELAQKKEKLNELHQVCTCCNRAAENRQRK